MATTQSMKLKRILGFTTSGKNSFISQPNTGNLIYIAGCVVVILDPKLNTQKHLFTGSKLTITTLAISDDGQYLATANCGDDKGRLSMINVWDLVKMRLIAEFAAENNELEVSCMSFSHHGDILVSVGCSSTAITRNHKTAHPVMLNVWDWQKKSILASHKLSTPNIHAVSFSADGSYFVTVGEAYVKYWYINQQVSSNERRQRRERRHLQLDNENNLDIYSSINKQQYSSPTSSSFSITGRSATLGDQKKNIFYDVKCGRGPDTLSSTFCLTKTGLLCELNHKRLLHKWVDLRTSQANCLTVGENLIVIGCANGIIRCFNTTELKFLRNLPRPHSLGMEVEAQWLNKAQQTPQDNPSYPAVIGINLQEGTSTISCIYNDRSIYVWNSSVPNNIVPSYSAFYHSSCIWGIDMYSSSVPAEYTSTTDKQDSPAPLMPTGSFVTCSSDDTLRIWNPNVYSSRLLTSSQHKDLPAHSNSTTTTTTTTTMTTAITNRNNIYKERQIFQELMKVIYTDSTYKFLCDLDTYSSPLEVEREQNYDSNIGLRCLKISPNGKQMAVGSRSGAIKIFDIELDIELKHIAAHDAEVLCLEYSDPMKFAGYCYLASSSRDKLIHIFDASNQYVFLQTIDDHLSSITALRFVNNRARDSLQLISCGADKRIIFRNGLRVREVSGEGVDEYKLNFVSDQIIEGKNIFYNMEVDSDSSCLMTACQDRMIRLFNVAQGSYQSGFKGSGHLEGDLDGEKSGSSSLIKITLDPSCTFLAASSTDKRINIYDYQRGECVASIDEGLSDLVTDMKFSPDGRHLITCSGDGCIQIWTSPIEIVNAVVTSGIGSATNLSLSSCSLNSLAGVSANDENPEHLRAPLQPTTTEAANLRSMQQNQLKNDTLGRYQVFHSGENSEKSPSCELEEISGNNIHQDSPELYGRIVSGALNATAAKANQLSQNSTNDSTGSNDSSNKSNSSHKQRPSLGVGDGLVSTMAKFFQSGANMDKTSARDKYLADNLVHNLQTNQGVCTGKAQLLSSDCPQSSSLSGMFNNIRLTNKEQTNESRPVVRSVDHHQVKPLSQAVSNESPSPLLNYGLRDESSDDDNNPENDLDVSRCQSTTTGRHYRESNLAQIAHRNRPVTPPSRLSRQRQLKRNSALNPPRSQPANIPVSPGDETDLSKRNQSTAILSSRAKTIDRKFQMAPHEVAIGEADHTGVGLRIRSSKSECNLAFNNQLGTIVGNCEELNNTDNNQQYIYCEKLDLSKLNPANAGVNQELCQYVVEELQAISKYATRLHQRLQAQNNKPLMQILSRGVQNSMDILSIVPPRAHHNHQHHDQSFQSQFNLATATTTNPIGSRTLQSATVSSRTTRPIKKSNSLLQSTTTNRAPTDSTKHQLSKQRPSYLSTSGSQAARSSFTGEPDRIDQVLEHYSDRLFKMVQARMVDAQVGSDNRPT